MPISSIILPDDVIAGGFILGGKTYQLLHSQIPGGSAVGKRRNVVEYVQLQLDLAGMGMSDISEADVDLIPLDDPDHPDTTDPNPSNLPVYSDPYDVSDDGVTAQVNVRDRMFIYQQNPQNKFLISRSIWYSVTLVQENYFPSGGDLYSQGFRKT